ncbi:GNAT family N-acetyltransferase [Tritonibacter mobilis]|uniref:GNAT family N-acetyltransferase n=1 Tax=Tritonibacter mobilis TaxID=379347 RepID=UPI0014033680|nr:GNAT family N-acetyltransferase [Tritonibacter mobilis]NHM17645.1 GNAT family N-acetyltransferase [Tritonibacter mobilis]NHM21832.1 GNAT family N-acetyltransferase [Tritonibacter mobilis]
MTLRIETLTGAALEAALDDVARLRIEVFRAWPYLYDGDLAYEREYLQSYRDSAGAVVVGAFDADRLVGAATGTPLADHADDFAAAFAESTLDMADIFYCAESVLLPAYRGQGAGHGFFDAREAHARELGFAKSAFCSVIRPKEHPLHHTGYTPLDPFWRKRGYQPLTGVVAEFAWKDIDQPKETTKTLQFWLRDL